MFRLNSIVIKLWLTIILIVTTVLIILSFALVNFFNSYFVSEVGQDLYQTANKIEEVLMSHHRQADALDYAKELVENPAGLIIIKDKADLSVTSKDPLDEIMLNEIRTNRDYKAVFDKEQHVTKNITVSYQGRTHHYILLGFPSQAFSDSGAIVIYQDINSMADTFRYVNLIILMVTLILIILTTIFAFFLSTRITKPLLMLKDSAFKLAKGERSEKIKSYSRDEIGELAIAFNKMENDIRKNINFISEERNLRDRLIDAMADGVLSYNLDLEKQLMNPAAESFLSQMTAEDKVMIDAQFVRVVESQRSVTFEITGMKYFVIIMSPIIRRSENRGSGAVALIRDMTVERTNDEMKKQFIANVSHELRTPIQMLQGYTEALLDGIVETKEEQDEFLNIILDESRRLNRMVNELLNVARYDAGEQLLTIESVNVSQLFEKIKSNFQQIVDLNQVDLRCTSPDIVWQLDYDKMIQVLTNLIDNAVRYTHQGDVIELTAEAAESLVITVRDSGVGIDAQHLPQIFDRFYKVDAARTRGKHGTGLGLFIVKAIIEAHGGTITVNSEVGTGTVFTISIPGH